MIHFYLYKNTKDVYSHFARNEQKPLFVAPSSATADVIRFELMKYNAVADVITFSTWLRLLSENNHNKIQIMSKVDLYAILGRLFFTLQKYKSHQTAFSLFSKAYVMLTDWRSYGTNQNLIENIAEASSEELASYVVELNQVMATAQINDEHSFVETLINSTVGTVSSPQKIVFWGYDFFSPLQVTLFEKIAEDVDVIFPIVEDIYNLRNQLDWMQWFQQSHLLNLNSDSIDLSKCGQLYLYSDDSLLEFESQYQYLAISSAFPSTLNIHKPLYYPYSSKMEVDLYSKVESYFMNLVTEKIKVFRNTGWRAVTEVIDAIIAEAKKERNMRLLRVGLVARSIIHENFNDWQGDVEYYHLKLLSALIELNRKRSFVQKKVSKGNQEILHDNILRLKVTGDDTAYIHQRGKATFLCDSKVNSNYQLESFLASLGPVKRAELSTLFNKARLSELISQGGDIYLPHCLRESSYEWEKFISEFTIYKNETLSVLEYREKKQIHCYDSQVISNNYVKKRSLSPSATEKYVGCPRSYYYSYLSDIPIKDLLPVSQEKMELGNLAHLAISFIINNGLAKEEAIKAVAANVNEVVQIQLDVLVSNALCHLQRLKVHFGDLQWVAEKEVLVDQQRFRIDLAGIDTDGAIKVIVDWKLSKIPTKNQLKNLEKIQVGYYMLKCHAGCGAYLSLSEVDEEIYLAFEETHIEYIDKSAVLLEKQKYRDQLSVIQNHMIQDQNFSIKPGGQCFFCDYKPICSRMKSEEVFYD